MKLQIQRQSRGYAWQRKALGQVANGHSWESGPNVQKFDCSWLYPWLFQPANTYNWVDTTRVQKLKLLWVLWTSWNHVCRWNWNTNLKLLKRNFQRKEILKILLEKYWCTLLEKQKCLIVMMLKHWNELLNITQSIKLLDEISSCCK